MGWGGRPPWLPLLHDQEGGSLASPVPGPGRARRAGGSNPSGSADNEFTAVKSFPLTQSNFYKVQTN